MDSSPAWGMGGGLITLNRRKPSCYEIVHISSEMGTFLGMTWVKESEHEI
jgi:hypothetical protein